MGTERPIATWSSIELSEAINRSAGDVLTALKEVDRLRDLLIEIVDICNTDPITWQDTITVGDVERVLSKIDDTAHGYFNG